MSSSTITPKRTLEDLFIVFTDVAAFTRIARNNSDEEIAEVINDLYCLIEERTVAAGGRVVKFLGDGALLVWDPEKADEAVAALIELRAECERLFQRNGWDSTLKVKVHAGPAVTGVFGNEFDIVGKAVNTAATLETRTMSLSHAAFRTLSPETRQLLKKHTPPVVYIPMEDARP